jgi:chemotaxis protein CheY-P-specific phosphatase CheC
MKHQQVADEYLSAAAEQVFEALGQIMGDEICQTEVPNLLALGGSQEGVTPALDAPAVALRVSTTLGEEQAGNPGEMLILLEFDDARRLVDVLGVGDETGDVKESALAELTNIVAGNFASTLFDITGHVVRVSVPEVHMDMYGSIVETFMAVTGDTELSVIGFRASNVDAWGILAWLPNEVLMKQLLEELGAERS